MSECHSLQREKKPEAPISSRRIPYAMAYVRTQEWESPFPAQKALQSGTAFPSLVKPFRATEGAR